jgi:hypothetical protein
MQLADPFGGFFHKMNKIATFFKKKGFKQASSQSKLIIRGVFVFLQS